MAQLQPDGSQLGSLTEQLLHLAPEVLLKGFPAGHDVGIPVMQKSPSPKRHRV